PQSVASVGVATSQVTNGALTPYTDLHNAASQALGSGSYSISTITIGTLFGDLSANGEISKAFERFVQNRGIVRDKLQAANPSFTPTGSNTPTGFYSYNSQDVLLPAFLDAYWGHSSDDYKADKFDPFAKIPLPNWTVQYNGLADLPGIRNVFRSFTLNHAYSSVYNLGSYTTTTNYEQYPEFAGGVGPGSVPYLRNSTGQYVPYYVIGQVSFLESLAPLIGVNFQTNNNVTGRVDYRTSRAIALNITNAQVTELHTDELVIGLGYSARGLKVPFRIGGEQRTLKNTLSARLDLSIRDNYTVQRSILGVVDPQDVDPNNPQSVASVGVATSQVTNGALTVQMRPTIDYLLNARLNLQFYFTQTITQPRVSNAFRNATSEGGIQLRYSLQ
ncbi:MAG: cell surface protein SprA, partial [Hymenobacter sp.]